MAVTQDDVAVMYALTAQGQTSVDEAVVAVLHDDPLRGAVLRLLVCPRAFAALNDHGIVIDADMTAMNEDIATDINI